jgi:dCMP deaminase
MARQDWHNYFMTIAHAVATRSTCNRKAVGCVLTIDRRIIASGYNGSIPRGAHCDDVGHDLVESLGADGVLRPNCVRTTHAETNAIAQAARFGAATDGAIAYVNTFPCWPCFKVLASAGVKQIYFDDEYRRDDRVERGAQCSEILICGPGVWKV